MRMLCSSYGSEYIHDSTLQDCPNSGNSTIIVAIHRLHFKNFVRLCFFCVAYGTHGMLFFFF